MADRRNAYCGVVHAIRNRNGPRRRTIKGELGSDRRSGVSCLQGELIMAESPQRSPTAHVRVVFTTLACVIALAVTARWLAYPKTYGEFGHFRGAAIPQAMVAQSPLHTDGKLCYDCHKQVTSNVWKDVHEHVQCETCHGPGERHIAEENKLAVTRPDAPTLRMDKTASQCLTCHRRLNARPASFPQIDRNEHFKMLHLANTNTACIACHDPHQPLFLDKNIQEARLHPLVNKCVDCHKHEQDVSAKKPADHPVLFDCSYCHKAIAKDYATRAHKDFSCSICHQVYPVSDRAVRVIRHRDPQFCMLCHSGKIEKDKTGPPAIKWTQHLQDVSENPVKDKDKVCADCHSEAFHLVPSAQIISATKTNAGTGEKKP